MNFSGKEHSMKKPFRILLILVTAVMLFASGYAYADTSEELIYDENDNTWAAGDEHLSELIAIMKRECTKSSLSKGTYILASDGRIIFIGGMLSWVDCYDKANVETKHMIISRIIERVEIKARNKIHIKFKISLDQFMGRGK